MDRGEAQETRLKLGPWRPGSKDGSGTKSTQLLWGLRSHTLDWRVSQIHSCILRHTVLRYHQMSVPELRHTTVLSVLLHTGYIPGVWVLLSH